MEKEQSSKIEENINDKPVTSEQSKNDEKSKEEKAELTPEDKIKELENNNKNIHIKNVLLFNYPSTN